MKLLGKMLHRFVKVGELTVIDANGLPHVFGPGGEDPSVTIKLHDRTLHRKLFLNPELVAGEAYMDGTLTVEQGGIRDFLKVFAMNAQNLRSQVHQKRLRAFYKKIRHLHQRNFKNTSRQNVEHHYDLSNDFYKLFLDEDMQYSCAYFENPNITLEQAQFAKKRHIASKLDLKPGQRVLDIGCGWGGMAIYLAETFDVHVTGVTLSMKQYELGCQRVKGKGLEGKVDLRIEDYRDQTGPFDRIVSVGMFEHVGAPYYPEFFNRVSDLLTEDGVALLHSIGRRGGPGSTARWIRKYIFPGGYSPALSETLAGIEKSGMWVTDIEILRLHYAETCLNWEKRFQKNRDMVASMMGEHFCRMWEFYLIVSEYSFRYGKNMVFQIQMGKQVGIPAITRDYMFEAETHLRKKHGKH